VGKRAMLALIGIGMVSLMGCNGESMLEPEQATADGREVVVVDGASAVVLDVRNGVARSRCAARSPRTLMRSPSPTR